MRFWRKTSDIITKSFRENEPCHLYFDLEFNIHANPGIDGVKSTDALLDLIKEELYEKHNIAIELNKHVVELESIGTDNANKKFSRHVIIRLPGAAFKSNIHVGKFVKDFWNSVCEKRTSDDRWEKLFIRKEPNDIEGQDSIIDLGCTLETELFVYFYRAKQRRKKYCSAPRDFGRIQKNAKSFIVRWLQK